VTTAPLPGAAGVAYVSIRQGIRQTCADVCRRERPLPGAAGVLFGASIRQGIREHTSGHTSAYVSMRLHTSACVSIRAGYLPGVRGRAYVRAYVRIRQHASAYLRAICLLVSEDELCRAHRRCALLDLTTRLFLGARARKRCWGGARGEGGEGGDTGDRRAEGAEGECDEVV
jgi:hypothetical protein